MEGGTEGWREVERERGREGRREIRRSSMHWFTPQIAAKARAALVRSWEPTASGSSMWVQMPKHFDHPALLSQTISREVN